MHLQARLVENNGMNATATQIAPVDPNTTQWRLARSIAVACLVAILVFLFHLPYTHSNYLLSDSADYARAARSPILHTWLDTDSASVVHLFEMRQKDTSFRAHPWESLYAHQDNAALRHFHPPLSFYAMHIVELTGADSHQRITSSLVTAATCGILVLGLTAFGVPLTIAGLAALVAGIQGRYVEVSATPTPHSWSILFAVLFLFIFAWYLQTRRFWLLAIAAVLLACSFANLEFSLELVCAVPIALVLQFWLDKKSLGNVKQLGISFLKAVPIFLAATFVVWPGGWLRGGYLESYGVNGAMLLFKNKAFAARGAHAGLYEKLFGGHEALLLLFAFVFVAVIALVIRRRLSIATLLFLSYTFIALGLGIADHFRLDTYVSELLLFLIASAALLFQDLLSMSYPARQTRPVLAFALLLVIIGAGEWLSRPSLNLYQPWLQPVLAGVSAHVPPGSVILVNDYEEAYVAYLPRYVYEATVSPTDLTPRDNARDVHFFLLTQEAPPVPDSSLIESFPTAVPGRSVQLYATR
jgi:hypothetical protein